MLQRLTVLSLIAYGAIVQFVSRTDRSNLVNIVYSCAASPV